MPWQALTLILFAALIHASWNLIAKKSGGDARFALFTCVALAIIWSPLGLWCMWQDLPDFGWLQWMLVIVSGALHLIYYLILLRGYRVGDLSVVYPLARGSAPLLTAIIACFMLDESLRFGGWFGVAGIVGGILLIAGGRRLLHVFDSHAPEARRLKLGVRYGLLTGFFITAYSLVDGYAVKRAAISPIIVDYLGNLTRLPLLLLVLWFEHRRQPLQLAQQLQANWRTALLVGAISPVSYVMVLYAARIAPLSQVAPMRELSMLFATLFGGALLKEAHMRSRLAGAGLIAGGVILLSLQ